MQTTILTAAALIAFAANSVLCRVALGQEVIDAATFSAVRLVSGALTLTIITVGVRGRRPAKLEGSWRSAGALFLYAVPFSFAYNTLDTGTGALILFGSVQLAMMASALRSGERPHRFQWFGLALAFAGLVFLFSPGVSAPPPEGAALMALAGISWGIYSLRGGGREDPIGQTMGNFVRTVPLALLVSLAAVAQFHASTRGLILAATSGALASGLGYAIWYRALRSLTAIRASVVQLLVPVLLDSTICQSWMLRERKPPALASR